MSSLGLITQQAERDGVSAPTVERDYVLAHIIAGLGSLGIRLDGRSAVRKAAHAASTQKRYALALRQTVSVAAPTRAERGQLEGTRGARR